MDERRVWLDKVFTKSKKIAGVPVYGRFGDGKWCYTFKTLHWKPDPEDAEKYPEVTVPEGFVTDLTSVPRALWSYIPPFDTCLPAAIIHDLHYWKQSVSRDIADEIFDKGMQFLKVPSLKRKAIYQGVRIGGQASWDGNAKLKASGEQRFLIKYPDEPGITWEFWKKQPNVFKKND